MQKAKGSWAKVGAMTVLLCVCLGLAYGWRTVQQEKQQAEYDATLRRMGLEHLYKPRPKDGTIIENE
jgi:hypothetical protein